MELREDVKNAKLRFNTLLSNILEFKDEDTKLYDDAFADVFSDGINFSYMSAIFFAQYSAELLIAMICSNTLCEWLVAEIEEEKHRGKEDMHYWEESMNEYRFGLPDLDYADDSTEIMFIAMDTYSKIEAINRWYGTDGGRKELEAFRSTGRCMSSQSIRDMVKIVCEYPYLIRRYDFDKEFACDIMEYAGIIEKKITQKGRYV
ncbi:MAG: hypothetical protein IJ794_15940 [Lachnospiraceae bacterium]|nr:hypothetical protein [Lachnospiraceae bacterium]